MEAANLAAFLKFRKAKIKNLCYLCKKSWVATKLGGGLEQNWGPVPPRPGPKTATGTYVRLPITAEPG